VVTRHLERGEEAEQPRGRGQHAVRLPSNAEPNLPQWLVEFVSTEQRKELVMGTPTIATIVFPARDFEAGVTAWTSVFGTGPAFSSSGQQTPPGEADFAVFKTPDLEIGLTSLPWVDAPLVFIDADDIEEKRRELIGAGATALGEVADGSLAEIGTAPITNGDAETGVVEVPGAKLAVVRLADGNLLGLRQALPVAW
jgi:hypothetical protein